MSLALYVLGRIALRALAAFLIFEGILVALTLLEVTQREPLLGAWSVLGMAPIFISYSAVPCALAALAAGTAGCFAELVHEGELVAASAAGIGPLRWLAPVLLLGALITPWSLHAMADVLPTTRGARRAERALLRRSPETCLRILAADPAWIPGVRLQLIPGEDGGFQELWLAELDSQGLPTAILRAERGRVGVPERRDVLQLELEGAQRWRRGDGDTLETMSAGTLWVERPLAALAQRETTSILTEVKMRPLGQLLEELRGELQDYERRLVRGEVASRFVLGLIPVPLLLAAALVGLRSARWGAAGGALAGVVLTGAVALPLHAVCVRRIAAGGSLWLALLPAGLLLLVALPALARWRFGWWGE